ncbi:MAG: hypothetical protein J0L51_00135 [Rhizobiales bacterium]|nr:hypothetical protein [Hyphomicrobiales bacterium]
MRSATIAVHQFREAPHVVDIRTAGILAAILLSSPLVLSPPDIEQIFATIGDVLHKLA